MIRQLPLIVILLCASEMSAFAYLPFGCCRCRFRCRCCRCCRHWRRCYLTLHVEGNDHYKHILKTSFIRYILLYMDQKQNNKIQQYLFDIPLDFHALMCISNVNNCLVKTFAGYFINIYVKG